MQRDNRNYAEQIMLGSCLIDVTFFVERVQKGITKKNFTSESHRLIWQAMMNLDDRGQPVDMLTVEDELGRMHVLSTVGSSYLSKLVFEGMDEDDPRFDEMFG